MTDLVTDAMVEAAGKLLPIHDRVDTPSSIYRCLCGWRAEKPHDVDGYDQHRARLVLEAAAPLIAAAALRDFAKFVMGPSPDMQDAATCRSIALAADERARRAERGES